MLLRFFVFFLCVIYAKVYYFHCNASGLPEELTDQAGQLVWRARYSTWGKLVFENISHFAPKGFSQNLRMQGQYADKETGLYYNTFRYYDPEIGRFTTEDPIGLLGGVNLYQYAPNPLMWIDPWGWSNSGQLNKKLDGTTHDGKQAHHIIPVEVFEKKKAFFQEIGFDTQMNEGANGVLLPDKKDGDAIQHRGSHSEYTKSILKTVNNIEKNFNNKDVTKNMALKQLAALQNSTRPKLLNGTIKTQKGGRLC